MTQVGAYRKPYLAAAKDTLKLIQTRGIEMIVNDVLVDGVLDNGRWLGALTCAGASVVVGKAGFQLPWILVGSRFLIWAICISHSITKPCLNSPSPLLTTLGIWI